ncbi:hypothetical protein LY78DRAFT_251988 [Colletotrichum sublineola]|nr:hypothetical protein LY78DRAFT_251988 [Colletotrichum sublineola]
MFIGISTLQTPTVRTSRPPIGAASTRGQARRRRNCCSQELLAARDALHCTSVHRIALHRRPDRIKVRANHPPSCLLLPQSHAACLGTMAHTDRVHCLALRRLHPYSYVVCPVPHRTALHTLFPPPLSLAPLSVRRPTIHRHPSVPTYPPLLKRRLFPICFHCSQPPCHHTTACFSAFVLDHKLQVLSSSITNLLRSCASIQHTQIPKSFAFPYADRILVSVCC